MRYSIVLLLATSEMRPDTVGFYDLVVTVNAVWYLIPLVASIVISIAAFFSGRTAKLQSASLGICAALFLLPWTSILVLLFGEQIYFKKDVDNILRPEPVPRIKPCYLSMEISGPASGNFELPRWADGEVFWLNQEGIQKYKQKFAFTPILISVKPSPAQSTERFTFSLHPEPNYRLEARLAARTHSRESGPMYQFLNVIGVDRESIEISVPELDESDNVLIMARLVTEHEGGTLPHDPRDAVQPPRVEGCR